MGNNPLLGLVDPAATAPSLDHSGSDPDRGGQRSRTNEAPHQRYVDGNFTRDELGILTTRTRIGDVRDPTTEPGEPKEPLLDQGLTYRQKY